MAKKKRRRKAQHLVSQHLENVSAKLLRQYQDDIKEYLRRQHGVYALYNKRGELYYVGLASNLRGRLKQHLNDHHKGLWDRFSVYLVRDDRHMKELESLILRIVMPKGNKQKGKLMASVDLKRELAGVIRDRHKRELEELVGKKRRPPKKTSIRKKRKRSVGEPEAELKPYVTKRMTIKGTFKGYEYKASLRSDGWINYDGYLYATPTGAANAALKKRSNGWHFWKYRNEAGEWVRLRKLLG